MHYCFHNLSHIFHLSWGLLHFFQAYPYKADLVKSEARKDTPPFYRSLVWAALLGVDGAVADTYQQLDKETPTLTDRQVSMYVCVKG